LKKQTGRGAAW